MSPEWRSVPGYEDLYEVSSCGQVRSLPRQGTEGRMLITKVGRDGYPSVKLWMRNREKTVRVHALVALAFIGPRPNGQEVRHLDGDRMNPESSNLSYGTRSENNMDKVRHGTDRNASKTHCLRGHEFTAENTYLNQRGGKGGVSRQCRECIRLRRGQARRPRLQRRVAGDMSDDLFGMVATDAVTGAHLGNAIVRTHDATKCAGRPCVLHNPSDHHMRDWPTFYRADRGLTERICPHGIGHPDPDDLAWHASQGRRWQAVHGCDGCCR